MNQCPFLNSELHIYQLLSSLRRYVAEQRNPESPLLSLLSIPTSALLTNCAQNMANTEVEAPPVGLPDYLLDPNAVLKDISANWRYGKIPDYSETRKIYGQSTCFFSFH
jgi:hypothetical protein